MATKTTDIRHLAQQSDDDIRAVIEPLIDTMLEGSTNRDHATHTRDFTDRLKVIVTEDNLAQQCEDYQAKIGLFTRREFIALFRRQQSVAATWRIFASKSDDEFVMDAVFVERDGHLRIDHCMIF